MKRTLLVWLALLVGVLVITTSTVFAQGGGPLPPPSSFLADAILLARAAPLAILAGVLFGLWQAKLQKSRPKSAPNSPNVTRHDFGSVVAHWTNGLGFIISLLTGAMVLKWIGFFSDLRTVFLLHYIGAALILFGVFSHLAQHFVAGGFGLIPRSFRDVREGLGELIEYTGVFGPEGAAFRLPIPQTIRKPIAGIFSAFGVAPPQRLGKYLPAEKVFSYAPWVIIVTVIVVTGLVKALRYIYPIAPEFVAQMTTWHDLFTAISVIMFAAHIAAVTLAPRNWPLLVSMFTMRVSRKHVEQWHPLWFKELTTAEQPSQTDATAATVKAEQAKV